jgi:hypothetical protein
MHRIKYFFMMIAQKLYVVVGHFMEARVSVLGLLLDHLLEELLGHLLGLLLLFSLSSLFRRLPCRIITILNVFIT